MSSSSEHIKEMRLDRSIVDKKEMRCRIYVNVKEIVTKIKCYFEQKKCKLKLELCTAVYVKQISNKHIMDNDLNWQKAAQLAIYKAWPRTTEHKSM